MTMLINSVARDHLHQFLNHYSNLSSDDRHNRFFSTMGPSAIRDWMTAITSSPNSHFFFVKETENGEFEGLVTMGIESDYNASLAISVLSESRGKGIAQNLLNEAIHEAKKMNLKRLNFECLLSNNECKRLFTKLGFTCDYSFEQQCLLGHLDLENYNV